MKLFCALGSRDFPRMQVAVSKRAGDSSGKRVRCWVIKEGDGGSSVIQCQPFLPWSCWEHHWGTRWWFQPHAMRWDVRREAWVGELGSKGISLIFSG